MTEQGREGRVAGAHANRQRGMCAVGRAFLSRGVPARLWPATLHHERGIHAPHLLGRVAINEEIGVFLANRCCRPDPND